MPVHLRVMHSILLVVFMILLLRISLHLLAERIKVLGINVRACGILRLW